MNTIKSFSDFINEKKDEKFIQNIHMKKGALKHMLGYSDDETIPAGILQQIVDKEEGSEIEVKGKKHKITKKMKKRASLAHTLKEMK
jgi:hypothetical protein